jgi:hypothetical protein
MLANALKYNYPQGQAGSTDALAMVKAETRHTRQSQRLVSFPEIDVSRGLGWRS